MKCYDCGSVIQGHHTALCDLAEANAVRDLPALEGTQYWTGTVVRAVRCRGIVKNVKFKFDDATKGLNLKRIGIASVGRCRVEVFEKQARRGTYYIARACVAPGSYVHDYASRANVAFAKLAHHLF